MDDEKLRALREAAEKAAQERDELRAVVERVRELAVGWEDENAWGFAQKLSAILPPKADQADQATPPDDELSRLRAVVERVREASAEIAECCIDAASAYGADGCNPYDEGSRDANLPLILALHSTPAITCPTREVVRVVNEQKALPGPHIQPVRKARVRIRPAVATPMACVRMPCPLPLALPGARLPQPDTALRLWRTPVRPTPALRDFLDDLSSRLQAEVDRLARAPG